MTLCYSAIDLCGAQINRNDCDGNILAGAEDVIVTCNFVDITATPIEVENNETSPDPSGRRGQYCAERPAASQVEGYEVEITLCSKTDVELMDLLGIFTVVKDADGNCVGIEAKCCGDVCECDPGEGATCDNPGVTIHLWHLAWCGNKRHPDYKWVVQTLPNVVFDPASVTITRNTEFQTYTLTGRSNCNENYGRGPGDIYPDPTGLEKCWAEFATNDGPTDMCDCSNNCGFASGAEAVGAP